MSLSGHGYTHKVVIHRVTGGSLLRYFLLAAGESSSSHHMVLAGKINLLAAYACIYLRAYIFVVFIHMQNYIICIYTSNIY